MSLSFVRGLHNLREEHRGCVATIGAFDGVHRGHQVILDQVISKAKTLGLPSAVIIFEPQPDEFFSGEQAPARLMVLRDKVQTLWAGGIDRVVCLQFNARLRSLKAEEFIHQVLVDGLGIQHLVVGDDFRFGRDRSGDYNLLKQVFADKGLAIERTQTIESEHERISSTRIRGLLEQDQFDVVEQLLGKPYAIQGRVVYGQQLGRTLGFPTANVQLKRYRSPLSGVFAVEVVREADVGTDSVPIQGVANIGIRPTIAGLIKPILEVFLLNFSGDIYGERLSVRPRKKLREEKKFSSLDELKENIQRDVQQAKAFFNAD